MANSGKGNPRIKPKVGQESVWDYPRPPRLEATGRRVRVVYGGRTVADSTKAFRVLETSHPPTVYIPQKDVDMRYLRPGNGASFCEFKGRAGYFDVNVPGQTVEKAAWTYENPTEAFVLIRDYISFYPSKADACYMDEEQVLAQDGDFYGGWITKEIVGPFKGGPGTWGW